MHCQSEPASFQRPEVVGDFNLEEKIATHSSVLAWKIPWRSRVGSSPWGCRVGHDRVHTHIRHSVHFFLNI